MSDQAVSAKHILVEINIGEVQTVWFNWAAFTWYVDFDALYELIDPAFLAGVYAQDIQMVGSVTCDLAPLSLVASAAAVQATEMTYYYDRTDRRLYIHLVDGDEPSIHRVVVGDVLGISNHAGYWNGMYWEPCLLSAPSISKSIDPLFWGRISFEGGAITLKNEDGFFDRLGEDNDIFGNLVRILVGFDDDEYADFIQAGTLFAERLSVGPETATLQVKDSRALLSAKIPDTEYTLADWPDILPANVGKAIPIGYGVLKGVPAVCTNEDAAGPPATFTFKLFDTSRHGINAITTVYVDGVVVVPSATNLSLATFSLATAGYDPGQTVTVDCQGFVDAAGDLIENAAAVIKDLLVAFAGIPDSTASFDLTTWATVEALAPVIGLYVADPTEIYQIIEDVCSSAQLNLIYRDDSRYTIEHYSRSTPIVKTFALDELMQIPTIDYNSTEMLTETLVTHTRNWGDGSSLPLTDRTQEADILLRSKVKRGKAFETLLNTEANAQLFSDQVLDLSGQIARKFPVLVKMQALSLEVGDFVKAPVTRRSGSGLIGDQVGRIESISKDLTGASIELGCRVVPRNLIDRGDCRSATPPMMFLEKVPVTADCTWTHDRSKQYEGMESYLLTKTVAAGTLCYLTFSDNQSTTDMHGAVPGQTVNLSGRIWVPSGEILGTEIELFLWQYYAAAWHWEEVVGAAIYDEWQAFEIEMAIDPTATGFHLLVECLAAAAITEHFWITDLRLDIVE